jgi:ABC-type dipeptide/oligopeptide/nickel transport system permease component
MSRYIFRRLLLLIFQLWGITSIVFVLVQILPGDPLYLLVGQEVGKTEIEQTRVFLGLDKPLYIRYLRYYSNLVQGDMGTSFFNSMPVASEILNRFPATIELVAFSLILSIFLGALIGCLAAFRPTGWVERSTFFYGMVSGALPEFWWGLVLILVLFNQLGIVAAPIGRLDIMVSKPPTITGMYTIDSLLTQNWGALRSSLAHLFLPVITLVFLNTAAILKMVRFQMLEMLRSSFVHYAKACGLPNRLVIKYAFINTVPAVLTQWALFWAGLVGSIMLIEMLFSWGGIGQYVVQAVVTADFLAATGAILAITAWSLVVYLILDILLAVVDPRVRY